MPYLFLESFDDISNFNTADFKWEYVSTNVSVNPTAGRNGKGCLVQGTVGKSITGLGTSFLVGFALKIINIDTFLSIHVYCIKTYPSYSSLFRLKLDFKPIGIDGLSVVGTMERLTNYAWIGQSFVVIPTGVMGAIKHWNHYIIEINRSVITGSSSTPSQLVTTVKLYRNLEKVAEFQVIEYAAGNYGSGYDIYPLEDANVYFITTNVYNDHNVDDVYITNDITLKKDLVIDVLRPNLTSSFNWNKSNPSADAHTLINEQYVDDDATYIYANAAGQDAVIHFDDTTLPSTQYVYGYQFVVHAKRDLDADCARLGLKDASDPLNEVYLGNHNISDVYKAVTNSVMKYMPASDVNDIKLRIIGES